MDLGSTIPVSVVSILALASSGAREWPRLLDVYLKGFGVPRTRDDFVDIGLSALRTVQCPRGTGAFALNLLRHRGNRPRVTGERPGDHFAVGVLNLANAYVGLLAHGYGFVTPPVTTSWDETCCFLDSDFTGGARIKLVELDPGGAQKLIEIFGRAAYVPLPTELGDCDGEPIVVSLGALTLHSSSAEQLRHILVDVFGGRFVQQLRRGDELVTRVVVGPGPYACDLDLVHTRPDDSDPLSVIRMVTFRVTGLEKLVEKLETQFGLQPLPDALRSTGRPFPVYSISHGEHHLLVEIVPATPEFLSELAEADRIWAGT